MMMQRNPLFPAVAGMAQTTDGPMAGPIRRPGAPQSDVPPAPVQQAAPKGPSPYAAQAPAPQMNLLQGAIQGFQRGFDPKGYQASQDQNKMDAADKQKQTLALMQQQRQLPMEQRSQWWTQNAPQISQIIGRDVSAMPVDPSMFSDQAIDGQIAVLSAQMGQGPTMPEPMSAYQQAQIGIERDKMNAPAKPGDDIRQVGNSIVQRQPDGNWKPVYTGSTPAETARAFQGFIDQGTGEQMLVMSDGTTKGTGRKAYVPPQITSVGGVPTAVDKRTLQTSELAGVGDVADNKAALASAEVQGKAQGQAAFDLPAIELRTQTAISSIDDLKKLNLDSRYGAQGKLWAVPGTEGANIQARITQVTSQAFLNAFDQLRGAGAITETEGAAATAAITRLKDQNITVGEALTAMQDLQNYYTKGLAVARQKARMAPTLPNRQAPGAAQSDLSQYSTEDLQRMLAGGQ